MKIFGKKIFFLILAPARVTRKIFHFNIYINFQLTGSFSLKYKAANVLVSSKSNMMSITDYVAGSGACVR